MMRRFSRDARGVSVVEFALIVPFVMFVLLAEFDTYRYITATQRMEIVAESVAQMFASTIASSTAVASGDGVVADWDVNFYENSAYFLYPDILTSPAVQQGTPWYQAMEVDVAGIKMVMQPDGTYKPQTAWHGSAANAGPNNRACNTNYTVVSDSAASTPTSLPQDVIGPNSLIVVDVRTTFQPTFGAEFLPSATIVRSVYMTPRNVPFVEYSGTGWMATNCS